MGLVVEENSHEGSEVGAEFSHLFLELVLLSGWEVLEGLSHGSYLTHEHEHVLC